MAVNCVCISHLINGISPTSTTYFCLVAFTFAIAITIPFLAIQSKRVATKAFTEVLHTKIQKVCAEGVALIWGHIRKIAFKGLQVTISCVFETSKILPSSRRIINGRDRLGQRLNKIETRDTIRLFFDCISQIAKMEGEVPVSPNREVHWRQRERQDLPGYYPVQLQQMRVVPPS